MFNSFPQPIPDSVGGLVSTLDWSAYQPAYDITGTTRSVTANSWGTMVNVTGKGFFKWCRADSNSSSLTNPAIRLTIDGQSYVFDTAAAGFSLLGNEINHQIPFSNSLKIEVQNTTAGSINIVCDYLYFLQNAAPNQKNITLLQQSQRKMAYLLTSATTLTDVVNITGKGYLLGLRFLGRYNTATAIINGTIVIDGTTKMNNRALFDTTSSGLKQPEVSGPIRFNSSLRVAMNASAAGSDAICFAWYSLD